MKGKLFVALILVAAVLCMWAPARANVVLGLNPSSQQVPLGSPISVDLTIAGLGNGTALGTYDIDVAYNSAIIHLSSVTYGTSLDVLGLGSIQTTTFGSGTVNVFELSLDSTANLNALQPPAFTLARLDFTSSGYGTSPLNMNINALGDANGNSLTALVNQGSVTVPQPPALFLIALSLVWLSWLKKKYQG
jgi:hypothetical protein